MTEKKIDKKEKEALKEQELDKVTGGGAEMPARPKPGLSSKVCKLI